MSLPSESRKLPGRAPRTALRVMQLGAVAAVLVVTTLRPFDLDRFFVPKELVLHATALLAGLLSIRAFRRARSGTIDLLLVAFAAISLVSAVLATNVWLGFRALAITVSSIVLFWCARALANEGLQRQLLDGLAAAIAIAATTSLLQTYGLEISLFSPNRAPGGTLGNRNFVAHAAAFGFPVLLLAALRVRRWWPGFAGIAMTTAALVLTRSRAAWLAFAVMALVWFVAVLASPLLRRDRAVWRRVLLLGLAAAAGIAAAILIPNTLEWRSRDPYLDTMRRVADYEQGSGRGRLVQYSRSLAMAVRNPVFGVGPGNWAVEYPARVPANDPSMNDSEPGMTFNPWPSSDWVAWVSERGISAAVAMALVFLGLLSGGLRQIADAASVDESLAAVTLLATLAAVGVTGTFDAVLLTAAPALLVWCALGALWIPRGMASGSRLLLSLLVAVSLLGAARSVAQLTAMQIFATRGDRASLERAARIDPGNFRVRLRLARIARRPSRCEHALAARALFPYSKAAIEVSRGCR